MTIIKFHVSDMDQLTPTMMAVMDHEELSERFNFTNFDSQPHDTPGQIVFIAKDGFELVVDVV